MCRMHTVAIVRSGLNGRGFRETGKKMKGRCIAAALTNFRVTQTDQAACDRLAGAALALI